MTFLQTPKHYLPTEFAEFVGTIKWDKGWKPQFPTLHNTGVPSLDQYMNFGLTAKERWGANLNGYYKKLGWHSGVHIVCCPDYIWNLCDLETDGVSVSCWNDFTIGIEMVGDYDKDDFNAGNGAKIRDNAVLAIAALSKQLGWMPDPLIVGKQGLHFHRMCPQDHHDCPGKGVVREEVVRRVEDAMATPTAAGPILAVSNPPRTVLWTQHSLNALGADPLLREDGMLGPLTKAAITSFQIKHGLIGSGVLTPATYSIIDSELKNDTRTN